MIRLVSYPARRPASHQVFEVLRCKGERLFGVCYLQFPGQTAEPQGSLWIRRTLHPSHQLLKTEQVWLADTKREHVTSFPLPQGFLWCRIEAEKERTEW